MRLSGVGKSVSSGVWMFARGGACPLPRNLERWDALKLTLVQNLAPRRTDIVSFIQQLGEECAQHNQRGRHIPETCIAYVASIA
jgi:hypothetical protein